MRKVDDDHARRRSQRGLDRACIERPVGRIERDERHVGPDGSRDFVQRLIRGPHDDGMILGREQGVHHDEDSFLGTGEGEDLVRRDVVVK